MKKKSLKDSQKLDFVETEDSLEEKRIQVEAMNEEIRMLELALTHA
jgi:hypothetical protein